MNRSIHKALCTGLRTCLLTVAAGLIVLVLLPASPSAQAAEARRVRFDIPAQSLSTALLRFSEQAKVQITAPSQLVGERQSPSIRGEYPAAEALKQMLQGSGLSFEFINEGAVAIRSAAAARESAGSGNRSGGRDNTASSVHLARAGLAADAMQKVESEGPAGQSSAGAGENENTAEDEGMVIFGERIVTRNRADTVEPVLVYSSAYFERFEPLTLNDMLKRVPGVYFDRLFNLPENPAGSSFAETNGTLPRFRNLDSQFSQILVNGRRIAGIDFGSGGDAFLSTIPAESIKEIRVIRSPSAEIDSSGVGMTLDVILKNGSKYADNSWRAGGSIVDGNLEGVGSVNVRGSTDRLTYSLSVTSQNRTGVGRVLQDAISEDSIVFPDEFTETFGFETHALTLSSQLDRDRSVIGNVGFNVGSFGKFNLEAKYVETRRTAGTAESGTSISSDTIDFGDGEPIVDVVEEDLFNITDSRRDTANYGGALSYTHHQGRLRWDILGGYDRTDLSSANYTTRRDTESQQTFIGQIGLARGNGDRIQLNNHLAWTFNPRHEVRLGADWQRTTDSNFNNSYTQQTPDPADSFTTLFAEDEQTIKRTDLFAVYEWRMTDALSLQLGTRHEKADYNSNAPPRLLFSRITPAQFQFDPDVLSASRRTPFAATVSGMNPSAHLRWEVAPNHEVRFSVARTVRRPNLGELDPRVSVIASNNPSLASRVEVGNPDLKNEEALGFDAGYDWRFNQGIIGINFFRRDIKNLIEQGQITPERLARIRPDISSEIARLAAYLLTLTPPRPLPLVATGNTDKTTRVHGVEVDMSFPLNFISENAHFYANATYARQQRTGEPSDESSAVNVSYDHEMKLIGFTYGASVNWVTKDKSHTELFGEAIFDDERELQPNVEIFLEKKFGLNLLARLSVENLTDARDKLKSHTQDIGFLVGESDLTGITESAPRFMLTFRGKF